MRSWRTEILCAACFVAGAFAASFDISVQIENVFTGHEIISSILNVPGMVHNLFWDGVFTGGVIALLGFGIAAAVSAIRSAPSPSPSDGRASGPAATASHD